MQPRESQLHLRLDTSCAEHTTAGCLLDQVFQECGLAHARFAADHQSPAPTCANSLDEPVEPVALAAPAHEPRRPWDPDRWASSHLHATDVTPRTDRRGLATGDAKYASGRGTDPPIRTALRAPLNPCRQELQRRLGDLDCREQVLQEGSAPR